MRTFVSLVLGLVFLAVLGGIGVSIYNAGVSAGLAQAGTVAAGAAAPYAYWGGGWGFPGFGFGFLGLLFPIFFLFLIFGLIRAAVFGGRRGWGPGYGHGWHGGTGPDGWRSDRERYLADMHRKMHEAEGTDPGSGPASGSGPTSGSAG
jgi:hypothetical protein